MIQSVGVVGAGTMGLGIVQVFAEHGYPVCVFVRSEETKKKSENKLEATWARSVIKGKISSEQKSQFLSNVVFVFQYDDMANYDLIIEAVPEIMELKQQTFAKLDKICKPETIIASNTSALNLSEIAASAKRKSRILGTHFFNPVTAMKLVEIIAIPESDPEVIETVRNTMTAIGKQTVCVSESPGFVVNRILTPYMCEAFWAYEEGLAPAEDIDKAMMLGAGMPMGPLALADVVGLDVCIAVSDYLTREFKNDKYKVPPCVRKLVSEGNLGRKSGKGFYQYT